MSTFTPVNAIDMSKERSWPADLGMLDWDSTSIVFTKRSLIEFLKYAGTTVDPNFTNISKLPRYAKFGKISSDGSANNEASAPDNTIHATSNSTNDFKPSRRVRTAPGGPQSDIFGQGDEDDALASAPRRPDAEYPTAALQSTATQENGSSSEFKPTRRVRTVPGGASSMANLWDAPEPEEFKPTRRVREGPGGQDNINGIF